MPRQRGKVTYCAGCLARAKNCYIKRNCKKLIYNEIKRCSECEDMPCKNLMRLDARYRERYEMSMVENLITLKNQGMDAFLNIQEAKYRCPSCVDVVCVHDRKCSCGYLRSSQMAPDGSHNFLFFFPS